ncbi:hypothetical protein RER_25060 [Rhodococcus erythropolis PR4]|uniref:Uncharacterized protein n=1 Tax=Rhodococcus erythropolis (strain PR4 / NBRC 100887) TaxID=234621 RepID=C0ZXX9_RHOE4|nr:hypothetical protein RER_25060 [Rhodococcus erythropolis PR4]
MPVYRVWNTMRSRCYNRNSKSYADYGARGILVCKAWRESYGNFITDMGDRPGGMTIDRIDNECGYTCGHCVECRSENWPSNVQWATRRAQARNTRRNRLLTLDGTTKTVAEWTELRGLGKGTIHDRLERGWSIEQSIDTPMKREQRYLMKKGSTRRPKNGKD